MPNVGDQKKTKLIEKIVAQAHSRLQEEPGGPVERFLLRYYENVPQFDLLEESEESLFGAAVAHWKLAAKRKPSESRVRVYNPNLEEHGWTSEHTIAEIVTDDMPFLVDSITAELNRQELDLLLSVHPVFNVSRDGRGGLKDVGKPESGEGASNESFMHFKISEQSADRLDDIRAGIESVLIQVRYAVEDWRDMRDRMQAEVKALDGLEKNRAGEELDEVRAFLQWIHDNHFTFTGYREYNFVGTGEDARIAVDHKQGRGILRDPNTIIFDELRDGDPIMPSVRDFLDHPDLLLVTKANRRSTVHRRVHLDAILIKEAGKGGKSKAIKAFAGLFTSVAYNRSSRDIPLLRRKVARTIERAGFLPASHDGKALTNILDTFPRDELFQVSEEHLLNTSLGILHLQERRKVSLFIRRDDFDRFISALVYVPRDQYSTDLRMRIAAILSQAFDGEIQAHYSQLGDSELACLHVIVKTTPGEIPPYDPDEIESRLIEEARSWTDHLRDSLVTACGEERGMSFFHAYRRAFRSSYRERYTASAAIADVRKVDEVLDTSALGMSLYRPIEASEKTVRFKVYHEERAIPLSDVLPMLEHMGLRVMDEIPYAVTPEIGGRRRVMIHDFGLEARDGSDIDLSAIRENFQQTFLRIWRNEVESDGFNGLTLHAGLDWRQVVVLRAYCKYLRQAGIAFSQAYMEQTLVNNPELAHLITALFMARFDPDGQGDAEAKVADIRAELDAGLEQVSSADEDRILRRFVNLVDSTLRTNFFQPAADGSSKEYVSFKLDSGNIDDLPLPRPMREIFVYSPRVEGVHLRFGKVARGGLRWSDRREDFRTEILGLVKAQQVKNAVIVPVGSKGGFVVKRPPAEGGREAFLAEGIECYKTLIRGMLDITDNISGDDIVPPAHVVRRDEDDPYLVVAADKGTATFSDIANGISEDYGFWLGDAFASGGSQGYDHKKMGITARGGWESVKRHFREMGIDTQAQPFSVIGVGDMSGDVFGNGMQLSPHIQLVAAFNHLHIFIDPDPDPAKSFAERQRLFNLPRSSWTDYDKKLISKGGGIFERSAKALTLTPQIKRRFAIIKDRVTRNELLRALLQANVDLLWFGGIGTYIKSTHETHADAGDRANDPIRIDAPALRCRVIGEGANLGVTQLARIEAGQFGVRLNADFIDNSAGVDCSDHEVNIKILLDQVVDNGDITTKQRNNLLAKMTDEVSDLVLRDNYLQTQAISMAQSYGASVLDDQIRLMRRLEKAGRLNREVEFLPNDEELAERETAHQGLTRPEIAVVLSYAKIWLYDELLQSDLPDDSFLSEDLVRYFPSALQKKYKKVIGNHRLRREIVATRATNSLVNRAGPTFVNRVIEKTGMPACDIARAYLITREIFDARSLWHAVEALDNKIPASLQAEMLADINTLMERGTMWFLRNGTHPLDIGAYIAEFSDGLGQLAHNLDDVLPAHYADDLRERAKPYQEKGVPEDVALRISGLINLASGCDIVRLAGTLKLAVPEVSQLYFAVGTRFHLGRLRAAAEALEATNHWQKLAVAALIEEIFGHQIALTANVHAMNSNGAGAEEAIAAWSAANQAPIERTDTLLSELAPGDINDLSMIAVASRQLRGLATTPQG